MKKFTFFSLFLFLLSFLGQPLGLAQNPSDLPVLSDSAAGCTYGSRTLGPTDFLPAGSVKNFEEIMEFFNKRDRCSVFFNWAPLSNFPQSQSLVKVASGPNTDPDTFEHLCTGANDPSCAASKWRNGTLWATPVMYKCESASDLNCIASLDIVDSTGNATPAKYLRNFPDTPEISAFTWNINDQKTGYPKGGAVPIWEFITPNGQVRIATTGIVEKTWLSNGNIWERPSATFQLSITPVRLIENSPGSTKPVAREVKRTGPNGKEIIVVATDSPNAGPTPECQKRLVLDTNSCLVRAEFPAGYSYRVTMQMPDDIPFFLNGRIQEPIAYTEPINGGHRVIIEGKPATSAVVAGLVPKAVMKSDVVQYIKNSQHLSTRFFQSPGDLPPIENRYLDLLNLMLPYFGDFTTYEDVSWNLKSTPTLGSIGGSCIDLARGQILGIVSTNATAFDGNPPIFEPGTKMISYQVAAPHLSKDGKSLNVGRYYMNANAKFLTCLLDVPKIPDVATVGIDYANDEKFVTTVSIKSDKNWVRLQADNFHFSSPKIVVSFSNSTEVKTVDNSSNSNPTPNKVSTPKKRTISCIKGKMVKKIVGINPQCPSGYRKK